MGLRGLGRNLRIAQCPAILVHAQGHADALPSRISLRNLLPETALMLVMMTAQAVSSFRDFSPNQPATTLR